MIAFNDGQVLQYVDGNMDADTAKCVTAAMNSDAELRQRINAMRASMLPYSAAYKNQSPPPLPESIRQSVNTWSRVARDAPRRDHKTANRIWHIVAVSGAIGLSFLMGFATSKLAENTTHFNAAQLGANLTEASDIAWAQRVVDYQSLYVENTVGSIKVDRRKASELLATLSASAQLSSHIPDLTQFGYSFVRAQELGYKNKPLVQLVYKGVGKKPLALCFMPSEGQAQKSLRLAQHEELGSASWRLPDQRFVLIAEEPTESLEAIARHVQGVIL